MNASTYDRHCSEIVAQTDLLRSLVRGAAQLRTPVPSCPGWNVGQLLRHLGGAHRWVEEVIRTGTERPPPDGHFRDLSPYADEDPAVLDGWLGEGAALLAETLRTAGPSAEAWVPLPQLGPAAAFFARRMANETAVHRADAFLAQGAPFTLGEETAADCFGEWLELVVQPQTLDHRPELRDLLGHPGRTLRFRARGTAPGTAADWLIDLTGAAISWRHAPREEAAVTVSGPLTDLLLVLYRRLPARSPGIVIGGDAELLDSWLERVSFG
ncbi:maleylpyruvate isomerase family mycothiol-dependent enzyme [Streptomyces chrestomyceticus]|uniref:maleylpyruvate isomerase family mycothiol-dependent enzyme n=1 Tax=Streptomyces chrestomyceticus TaxID=68185 RepID=UPI0035A8F745